MPDNFIAFTSVLFPWRKQHSVYTKYILYTNIGIYVCIFLARTELKSNAKHFHNLQLDKRKANHLLKSTTLKNLKRLRRWQHHQIQGRRCGSNWLNPVEVGGAGAKHLALALALAWLLLS